VTRFNTKSKKIIIGDKNLLSPFFPENEELAQHLHLHLSQIYFSQSWYPFSTKFTNKVNEYQVKVNLDGRKSKCLYEEL